MSKYKLGIIMIQKKNFKVLCPYENQVKSLEEVDNFLSKYTLPKLIPVKIENLDQVLRKWEQISSYPTW